MFTQLLLYALHAGLLDQPLLFFRKGGAKQGTRSTPKNSFCEILRTNAAPPPEITNASGVYSSMAV